MNLNFFSAPANLRYGHFNTNSKIQEKFDPITCGLKWNNNGKCIDGMTPKEKDLLALVYGQNQVDQDAALERTNLVNGRYFCSNCHNRQPNNANTNNFWYYMA